MKSYHCILVIITGTVLVPALADTDVKNKTEENIPSPSNNTVAELVPRTGILNTNICGGVLTSSSSTISYKNGASIFSNERCVWIIRPNNTITFTVNVASFGLQIQPGQTGMTATCFNRIDSPGPTSVAINRVGSVSLASTCHSLVITFYSGEFIGGSTGFNLSYSTRTGSTGAATTSKSYILNADHQQFRHPANANLNYTNSELTIFAIPPRSNSYSTARITLVTYIRESLEATTCYDEIKLYRFRPACGWSAPDRLCGNVEFKQWEDTDVMLLTFSSDQSVVGRGFYVVRSNWPW